MLNPELARILVAERRRELDNRLRIGRFRIALGEVAAETVRDGRGQGSPARSRAESAPGSAPQLADR